MAKKRPLQLDDLFSLRAVGRVALAPDGERVAFELKRPDPKENKNFTQLMLADARSGRVRSLTAGKFNYTLPKWSPCGRYLAFVSDREKSSRLFVLPMDGGEALCITDKDGRVADFDWSPDSGRLVYLYQPLSERETLERDGKDDELKKRPQFKHITRLFHKLDGAGWWNGHYTHVWITDRDGQRRKQLTFGAYDDREPRFSPDGKLVSFISNRLPNPDLFADNGDIYVVRPTGGAIRKLTTATGACAGHAWSPDGRQIAYIGANYKLGESWKHLEHVWVIPSIGGKARNITPNVFNDCRNLTLGDITGLSFEVTPPAWSAGGDRLYFMVSERGATRLYSQSLRRDDLRCELPGDLNLLHFHRTRPDGPFALSFGTAVTPGDVYRFDPGRDAFPQRLSDVNSEVFERVEVSVPESFEVRSDSTLVHGWVLKPPGFDKRRKYPAILQIHGGPHAQYGHNFFHELQWMAARGYIVVYTNPRGSAGYGLKYRNSIHADWGNLDYKDVMRAAEWMAARPYVDRSRLGITGGSYGGFMTNWVIGHNDFFHAAVTQRSVTNLESMFGTSDYGYDLGHEFGGTPWQNRALLLKQSPLTYVKNIHTPLLIEHEEQDHRCPIEQGEQLFACLKVLGREVEMVRFEGESHGLCRTGRPQNRAERLRRIMGWFERHIGDRARR